MHPSTRVSYIKSLGQCGQSSCVGPYTAPQKEFGVLCLHNCNMSSERCTAFPFLSFLFLASTWQPSSLKPGSFLRLHSSCSGSLSHLSSFSGTQSCVRSRSPFVDVCYHLYELPLMRLSGVQTLAWGWRRQGLEWGKCPHPSSQYRALSGAQPLSAAGKHPGIADGGRERERQAWADLFSVLCLSACVFLKLIKSPPPVFFLLFDGSNCR